MTTKTIKARANQTLHDIAVQYCGNVEAVAELLQLNGELVNDPAALAAPGIDAGGDFFLDVPLLAGCEVVVREDSDYRDPNVLRANRTETITTYTIHDGKDNQ